MYLLQKSFKYLFKTCCISHVVSCFALSDCFEPLPSGYLRESGGCRLMKLSAMILAAKACFEFTEETKLLSANIAVKARHKWLRVMS